VKFNIIETKIPEIKIIEPEPFSDFRGFFVKTFHKKFFEENIASLKFVEEDQSGSYHNVLRGLHYQINNPQGKLITITRGTIFDVAVDIRRSSSTFGQWVSAFLSEENKREIWIPPGFAHGFYTLSDWSEITYRTTEFYNLSDDRVLLWNDPIININWPLINGFPPMLSERDKNGKLFKDAECFD
jgi:dTDP-4-dehydrorhamnose 3,5-epimerase